MPPSVDVETLNRLTSTIIAAAIKIHRTLGPGLLESAYAGCLAYELRSLRIEVNAPVPLVYDGVKIDCAYRADLIVERSVVIEIKALESLLPIHVRQLGT